MLPWPGHVRLAETYFVVVDIFVLSYVNYMTGGGKCLKLVLFEKNWYEHLSNFCMIFWDLSFSFNDQCQCQRPDLSETFISDSSNKKNVFIWIFFSPGYQDIEYFLFFKFLTVWPLFSSKIFGNFGKDRL